MPVLLIWIVEKIVAFINSIIIHLAELADLCERPRARSVAVIAVKSAGGKYLHRLLTGAD